ncbi:sterol transporter outer membrane protein BstC [Methylobacter marinus]|uniref:sterol transporter outer membrane protein BstC n=1 Tax=Methylobacter marinus TaxID=34058 RepID=UPI001E39AB52|nr:sterol transporter outer membrane protein BstC [Methylobacter marinus]
MRAIRLLTAIAMLVLAGCAGLQSDRVRFDGLSGCPGQTAAMLAARQSQYGPLSDTHTLECALTVLRDSQDPALRRTSLGSRLSLHLAEREANPDRREKLAAEGVSLAEAALAQGADDDAAVHYYLAANLGLAVREHITLAMDNLERLEGAMKRALALNPDIDHGGPLRLLGALYLKAPAWPSGIGDLDKALELLEKAVNKHPAHPLNHLFYAQALWHEGDEAGLSRAKAEFTQGEKLLAEGNWGYSKESWKKEFAEFRQDLENGL